MVNLLLALVAKRVIFFELLYKIYNVTDSIMKSLAAFI